MQVVEEEVSKDRLYVEMIDHELLNCLVTEVLEEEVSSRGTEVLVLVDIVLRVVTVGNEVIQHDQADVFLIPDLQQEAPHPVVAQVPQQELAGFRPIASVQDEPVNLLRLALKVVQQKASRLLVLEQAGVDEVSDELLLLALHHEPLVVVVHDELQEGPVESALNDFVECRVTLTVCEELPSTDVVESKHVDHYSKGWF